MKVNAVIMKVTASLMKMTAWIFFYAIEIKALSYR